MLDNDAWGLRAPQNTLIVACYKVERYLPDFLASLDNQTANHSEYELVFVIDGCPENSEAIVREWMQHTDYAVRLISKPNGGVASARNVGLDSARGEWISCPDPDDWLAPITSRLSRARPLSFPRLRCSLGGLHSKTPTVTRCRTPSIFGSTATNLTRWIWHGNPIVCKPQVAQFFCAAN
ncbi:glycosyltransferase [Leucobacter coleopterorum]|uniref:Glycosyltransferase n=1 Tax=Leucobacter coleopterorum TaxID=2714933 RepID=A0ABX6JYB0_9MICO|nr:glycosyltransferase [Leucobacter coleopterorum]